MHTVGSNPTATRVPTLNLENMEVDVGSAPSRVAGNSRRVPGYRQHRTLAHSGGRLSDVFSSMDEC